MCYCCKKMGENLCKQDEHCPCISLLEFLYIVFQPLYMNQATRSMRAPVTSFGVCDQYYVPCHLFRGVSVPLRDAKQPGRMGVMMLKGLALFM